MASRGDSDVVAAARQIPLSDRYTRDYVLPCGCRRSKWSRSQRIAMLPTRFMEPWEVLEVDVQRFPNTSEAGDDHLLLVVVPVCISVAIKGSARSGLCTA